MTTALPLEDRAAAARLARLAAAGRLRLRRRVVDARAGFSASTSRGRLILTQSFEGCLAHHACSCPSCELDLGHQLGPDPMHRGIRARRARPGEGILLGREGFQPGQEAVGRVLAEARSHAPEMDEMPPAMNAHEQGAQMALVARPAADHHLVARAAFGLGPAVAAARPVGRVELLRDDSFQGHAAGRFQHRVAAGLEMLDEADQLPLGLAELLQHRLQPRLALARAAARANPPGPRTAGRRRRRSDPRSSPRTTPPGGQRNRAPLARPAPRPRRR